MTKILGNKLLVSEKFNSIQGEGKTSGVPAYFIRLSQCNISCGASIKYINSIKKGDINPDLNEPFVGDLETSGVSTWSCDTTPVWLRGDYIEFQELIDIWKNEGLYDDICSGLIHIIWTGGEPTIKQHQESIMNFLRYWRTVDPKVDRDSNVTHPFNEIETNGTIYINDFLFCDLDQINCSPKLTNSGMSEKQRIVPLAIERIKEHSNYQFKFVISNEDDIVEMFDTYIKPFDIPLKNVVCMPALTSREHFHERTKWCMEMAKKYKFIGLTRLHVSGWDSLTGV